MASKMPMTIEELHQIPGAAKTKLKNYGRQFLYTIRKFRAEHLQDCKPDLTPEEENYFESIDVQPVATILVLDDNSDVQEEIVKTERDNDAVDTMDEDHEMDGAKEEDKHDNNDDNGDDDDDDFEDEEPTETKKPQKAKAPTVATLTLRKVVTKSPAASSSSSNRKSPATTTREKLKLAPGSKKG
eukprot:GEZU01026535.1.p2 GENE.GEZU01026535.1~~GEZU01026535.1.p2  ORF type:complete len:185 (-),score=64.77 GEZU01026535.1:1371-1925(-)